MNHFNCQIDLYDAEENFVNRTFHWKVCRLPEVGQVVVFRSDGDLPNLVGVVENTAMVFDVATASCFDHILKVKLLSKK